VDAPPDDGVRIRDEKSRPGLVRFDPGDNAGDGIDVQDPVLAAEHDLAHRRSDPGTRLVGDGPHVTVPNVDDVDARHVPESRLTSPNDVGPGKGRRSANAAAISEGVAPGDQPRRDAGAR